MHKGQTTTAPTDRWVLIDVVVEQTGYSKNAIYAKKKGCVWTRGRFWVEAPDGRIGSVRISVCEAVESVTQS